MIIRVQNDTSRPKNSGFQQKTSDTAESKRSKVLHRRSCRHLRNKSENFPLQAPDPKHQKEDFERQEDNRQKQTPSCDHHDLLHGYLTKNCSGLTGEKHSDQAWINQREKHQTRNNYNGWGCHDSKNL